MMVPSPMLFAIETFPLMVYIFMALVVLSVPAFFVWEKVLQPKFDEKRKAEDEAEEAAEAEGVEPIVMPEGEALEGAEPGELEGIEPAEGAEAAEGAEMAEGAEGAEGAEVAVENGEAPQAEMAVPAEEGEGGEIAFEEAPFDDMFTEEKGEKP
jgi:hypothetical protein